MENINIKEWTVQEFVDLASELRDDPEGFDYSRMPEGMCNGHVVGPDKESRQSLIIDGNHYDLIGNRAVIGKDGNAEPMGALQYLNRLLEGPESLDKKIETIVNNQRKTGMANQTAESVKGSYEEQGLKRETIEDRFGKETTLQKTRVGEVALSAEELQKRERGLEAVKEQIRRLVPEFARNLLDPERILDEGQAAGISEPGEQIYHALNQEVFRETDQKSISVKDIGNRDFENKGELQIKSEVRTVNDLIHQVSEMCAVMNIPLDEVEVIINQTPTLKEKIATAKEMLRDPAQVKEDHSHEWSL